MRASLLVLAVCASACASGAGTKGDGGPDAGPIPDGAASAPDARPGAPDAPPGTPDAPPGTPDARPGTPDARPGTPDARPFTPDAPPGTPDAPPGTPDAAVPPSTANLGWIGGSCSGPATCAFTNSMCLRDGFPNGMCTEECTGICPDRGQPRDTVTACIDGRAFGFDEGLCVSRCDAAKLPPTGCAPGYRCLPKGRYLDASTVLSVCVPSAPAGPCPTGHDEIVDLAYPQDGAVWIPAEAQCGGAYPLVVLLHGINPSRNTTPSLGGGRHVEYEVRSLIDAGLIEPVLLAEPVQDDAASAGSNGLYTASEWEPAHHLDLVNAILDPRGISLGSLSYAGHSGAGCDSQNGLYLVLARYDQLIPAYAPRMRMWGLEDVCYIGAYHYQAPMATLAGTGTVIFNMWSVQNDPTAFENGLLPRPQPMTSCPGSIYTKCIHDPVEPWCSYRTSLAAGIQHDDNPIFFTREAFPQVFSPDPLVVPCR